MPSSQVSLAVAGPVATVSLGIGGTFFQALFILCFGGYGKGGMGLRRIGDRELWTAADTALRRLDDSFFIAPTLLISAFPFLQFTNTVVDGFVAVTAAALDVPAPRPLTPAFTIAAKISALASIVMVILVRSMTDDQKYKYNRTTEVNN